MKRNLILLMILLILFGSCKKTLPPVSEQDKFIKEYSNENSRLSFGNTLAANYLTFDQSFIDFVNYSTNNLGAGEYINKKLGNLGIDFINNLKLCNENSCITQTVNRYQLSIDTLDEYFYSALASALLFRVNHPEFDNMDDTQRATLFRQGFVSGMNSGDPRWNAIKVNLNNLVRYYYDIELYKAAGDWNDYLGCFLEELKGVFLGALKLGTIVEAIKTGNVAKGLKALKSFLKTTVGRTLTWIGIAMLAWDIFDCCWDVSQSGGGETAFEFRRGVIGFSYSHIGLIDNSKAGLKRDSESL